MVDTNADMGGDLDFKIEIADDKEGHYDSMGSGKNNILQGSTNQAAAQAYVVPGESLSDEQKKFVPRFLHGANHPGYCMLHIGFKLLALVCYLILGLLIDDKTFCFIIVIILSAIDFWLVKNVTGR